MHAIQVKPTIVDLPEAAYFVEPVAFTPNLETGHEFYRSTGISRTASFNVANTQPQPALFFIQTHAAWSGFRMPRGQKIGLITPCESTVTGSHQPFS